MTTIRLKPGDLFSVPLTTVVFAVGIILHVSKYFKGGILVGFFDRTFSSMEDVSEEKLESNFVATPNYTGANLIKKGPWKLIGHSEWLLEQATIPELAVVNHIYYKDEIVKTIPEEDRETLRSFTTLKGQGGIFIENRLRRYFGIELGEAE